MDRHNKNIVRLAIQMAMEDPKLVNALIERLEKSGEIEKDSLDYLRRIATKWEEVNQSNVSL